MGLWWGMKNVMMEILKIKMVAHLDAKYNLDLLAQDQDQTGALDPNPFVEIRWSTIMSNATMEITCVVMGAIDAWWSLDGDV